jgi:uncharacterized repeat protein (TIGR03806 family)
MIFSYLFWFSISMLYPGKRVDFERREKLSEYMFFKGELRRLEPSEGIFPYSLNTPLFSNYAEKLRFFKLPPGGKIRYKDSTVLDFPRGTVLIKNFYYPKDFRRSDSERVILETRLLVHEEGGWQAYPYIWNEEQTEAFYDPAGETREVKYLNLSGKRITTRYVIPNKNQCKGCHLSGDAIVPVGPSARQLNTTINHRGREENQLEYWREVELIIDVPAISNIPKGVVWDNPSSGTLNERARAYLDANCAHCHNRRGPANTSGLFLDVFENDPAHLGVNKSPVAAGRGSGNLNFDIVPGVPDKSILLFRMRTNDLSIAMPEIGREQVHKEGVALIEEWIRKNTFSN